MRFRVVADIIASHFWTVFKIAVWYGFSSLRLELGSSFSPSLAEDSPHWTSFFRLKKCVIFSAIAVTWLDPKTASLCCEALWLFNAVTVDWLKHLWDQDRDLVLAEISNSQLFSSAYIFNSQNWISARILRVSKREFRALKYVTNKTYVCLRQQSQNLYNLTLLPQTPGEWDVSEVWATNKWTYMFGNCITTQTLNIALYLYKSGTE